MSALAKKLSDQDKTSEFQIPDEVLKKEAKIIQEKHAAVTEELESVKKELPRRLDESTNVFTLRQVEMAHKVEELESKKSDFENQLLSLLQKQKTQINGDLQKVSKYLQQESKKNATVDRNILSRISQLASAREEMQHTIEMLKDSVRKSQMTVQDLKNGHSDVVYKLHSELQQSRNFEKSWQLEHKEMQATVLALKDEIHQLKNNAEKSRAFENQLRNDVAELKHGLPKVQEVNPQRDWEPEISALKDMISALKAEALEARVVLAPEDVEVVKEVEAIKELDQLPDILQKKIIFQKHLEVILTPDQQDVVCEMLDDFIASFKKK